MFFSELSLFTSFCAVLVVFSGKFAIASFACVYLCECVSVPRGDSLKVCWRRCPRVVRDSFGASEQRQHPLLPSCQASGSPRRRGALGARLRTILSLPRPGFQTSRTRTEAAADYDEACSTPSSAAVFAFVFAVRELSLRAEKVPRVFAFACVLSLEFFLF